MSVSTRLRASPPCSTSASTIEWVMRMRGLSCSGTDSFRRSKTASSQLTKPSGGFFFFILRSFFGSPAALMSALCVFDLVLGRLGDDDAFGVEARTPRAAGDLMELARTQTAHAMTVELRQLRQDHRVDGHVDADAERVGSADDGQKTLLSKLLDEQTVARQHARVVHADPAARKALERFAERRGEARTLEGLLDRFALLLRGNAVARERAGARTARRLGRSGRCRAGPSPLRKASSTVASSGVSAYS